MTQSVKQAIIRAFGEANNYHHFAHVQQQVAKELAKRLQQKVFSARPHILEIGCGSGFLSQHLLQRWPEGDFLFSDIAWPMLQRCRTNLGESAATIHYAVMDGEQLALAPSFELITASMVFQWFTNPIASLAGFSHLLRPGGCLAFATLGKHTFHEWQTACTTQGVASGLSHYPSAAEWQLGWQPQGTTACIDEWQITVKHQSSLAFLRELKEIGAASPNPDHQAQPAGVLRRLLRHLDQGNGFAITYHVLYGMFSK